MTTIRGGSEASKCSIMPAKRNVIKFVELIDSEVDEHIFGRLNFNLIDIPNWVTTTMTATATINDDGGNKANGPYSIQQFAYAWILLSRFMIVNHLPRLNDEICVSVCFKCVAHGAITSHHYMDSKIAFKKRATDDSHIHTKSQSFSLSLFLVRSLLYACLMEIQSKHTLHCNFKWLFHLIFI